MASTRIRITRQAPPELTAEQIAPRLTKVGNAIADRMRRLVPKDTFTLHDSISKEAETTVSGGRVTTVVRVGGGKAYYWDHVEYGTSKMSAQPYIRPAVAQAGEKDL